MYDITLFEKEHSKDIDVHKVASADNVADMFTKALPRVAFENHRNALRVVDVQHISEASGGALGV